MSEYTSNDEPKQYLLTKIKQAFGSLPFPFAQADLKYHPYVQQLRQVFDEPPYPYSTDGASGQISQDAFYFQDAIDHWYLYLGEFYGDTLLYVLARLMADLLKRTEYADNAYAVVGVLNVPSVSVEEYANRGVIALEPEVGTETVERIRPPQGIFRQYREKQFATITHKQAQVVLEWLRFVEPWEELEIWRDEVEAGIRYWQEFVRSCGGVDVSC